MKKTIILASVAVAAIFAFSSCQKEDLENTSVSGVRIITAEFENTATKTTLSTEDNVTPLWSEGNVIRVFGTRAEGNQYDDITLTSEQIKNDGRTITFTTTLTGILYAVYPASATTMESCSDGKITFTIPAVQDGTFASANICVAKSSTTDGTNKDKLVFSNATSVLEFSQTAATTKVLSVRVEAANAIAGPMTVNYKSDGTFDIPTTSSLSGKLIRVKSATAVDKYYIAVAPVATGKIEFEYQQDVKVATVTTEAGKTLTANTIYACSMDGKEFVNKAGTTTDGNAYVQVGSVKWATMNLGATTVATKYETCNGNLYSWGNLDGQSGDRDFSKSFTKDNYTSTDGAKIDNSTVFWDKNKNDAAFKALGGNWRMPTSEEFGNLCKACGDKSVPTSGGDASTTEIGIYWCNSYDGVAGLLFCDGTNQLFFPAAGWSLGYSRDASSTSGDYWSSTWSNRKDNSGVYAFYMSFLFNQVKQTTNLRHGGRSVRPVSD